MASQFPWHQVVLGAEEEGQTVELFFVIGGSAQGLMELLSGRNFSEVHSTSGPWALGVGFFITGSNGGSDVYR